LDPGLWLIKKLRLGELGEMQLEGAGKDFFFTKITKVLGGLLNKHRGRGTSLT